MSDYNCSPYNRVIEPLSVIIDVFDFAYEAPPDRIVAKVKSPP